MAPNVWSQRPPLLPSDPTNAASAAHRKPKSKEVASRYLSTPSSTPSLRRSPSRTAPNTPANPVSEKRSRSVDRRQPGTPELTSAAKLLVSNGSKRSLSVSFQGETFAMPMAKPPERKRNAAVGDENLRPSDQRQQWRWPGRSGSVTSSLECSTPEKKHMDGGSGGHVSRALLLPQSVDESRLSSGSPAASDLATSDSESFTSRKPSAIAVPARYTANKVKKFPEQTNKSFNNGNVVSSPPRMPGGRGLGKSSTRGSVRSASPNKVPSALSPSRGKLSPSRVRNDNVSNTPSTLSFANDVRRGKVGENKTVDIHELKMLYNSHLQWRFANARAASAIQVQWNLTERSLYNTWENTSKLRHSVKSKRLELQQLRQQLKLYSILRGQVPYLDDWDLLDGDYSSSVSGAVESLVASTLRLPIVGGATANIQEVEATISSACDVMHGIRSSLCNLLEKVVQTNSLASELADISSNEHASLDQCRDLLSTLTAMQVEDCSLRTQMLQVARISQCRSTQADGI